MTAVRQRKGRGTLSILVGLFLASALVRIGAEAGPALARDADEDVQSVTMPQAAEPPIDDMLAAFAARETRLTEREAQLRDRMQALRLAEMEIEEKLAALIAAEVALAATLATADEAAVTDLAQLTSVYENMKPREAAALFEEMPPAFAAGFLGMMRPDAAALIMTQLEPETAYSFSVVLAGRNANVPTE